MPHTVSSAPGFGVYVHFPFCRQRCSYCDFAVSIRPHIPQTEYLSAILYELSAKAPLFAGRTLRSVYFGGGTPSLWQPECLSSALQTICSVFARQELLEVTLECDPGDVSCAQLAYWHQAGVNRLSIGAQSFSAPRLQELKRQHTPQQIHDLVYAARRVGFQNLSLDLLFGMNEAQTELEQNLTELLSLSPEHVSLYQLTVEPHTFVDWQIRKGQRAALCPEWQTDAYLLVRKTLSKNGFQHYEISNFARKYHEEDDFRSIHNRLYWTGGEYLGLGASAHSFRYLVDGAGERFANLKRASSYLQAWQNRWPTEFVPSEQNPSLKLYEHRTKEALFRESLWLGLRELQGIDLAVCRHGANPLVECQETIDQLVSRGLLFEADGFLRLTERGVLFADEVGAAFL